MKKLLLILPIIICVYLTTSCGLIIEKDLKTKSINILSPADKDTIAQNYITFWWDEVEGATSYNLQIVKPSFSNITELVLDSNIVDNKFFINLSNGTYQWRIKAQNNSTSTQYIVRDLTVNSSDSLSSSVLILKSPNSNTYTNQSSIIFKWYPLSDATYYTYQLIDGTGATVINTNVSADSIVVSSLIEGSYVWKVRANNDISTTAFATRNITVDFTNPATPTLSLPLNADSTSTTVNLSWTRATDLGSPLEDSVLIYSDSLNTIVRNYTTSSTSYTFNDLGSGRYFWRVRTRDLATNVSSYSLSRYFYIR